MSYSKALREGKALSTPKENKAASPPKDSSGSTPSEPPYKLKRTPPPSTPQPNQTIENEDRESIKETHLSESLEENLANVAAVDGAGSEGILSDRTGHSSSARRQVIAVGASKAPKVFFNLARKFLIKDETCDLSALETAITTAIDAAHLLVRSQLATIVR